MRALLTNNGAYAVSESLNQWCMHRCIFHSSAASKFTNGFINLGPKLCLSQPFLIRTALLLSQGKSTVSRIRMSALSKFTPANVIAIRGSEAIRHCLRVYFNSPVVDAKILLNAKAVHSHCTV